MSLGWLSTSQSSKNGTSNGGFNHDRNKWYANVYIYVNGDSTNWNHYYYESMSWRKVDQWLESMRLKYDLR